MAYLAEVAAQYRVRAAFGLAPASLVFFDDNLLSKD